MEVHPQNSHFNRPNSITLTHKKIEYMLTKTISPPNEQISSSSSSSSGFFMLCILHSVIALVCGCSIMFCPYEISAFGYGTETARKLLGFGLEQHDQLLIQVSDSFGGLLLFVIGFLLFMVAFVKDEDFQSFFAKGCILLHFAMALWRVFFERRVEDLANYWPRQLVGDFVLALSWVFFLVYSWTEKYD